MTSSDPLDPRIPRLPESGELQESEAEAPRAAAPEEGPKTADRKLRKLRPRVYETWLAGKPGRGYTILLTGPRRVGITSLCKRLGAGIVDLAVFRQRAQFKKDPSGTPKRLGIDLLDRRGPVKPLALEGLLDTIDWVDRLATLRQESAPSLAILATGHHSLDLPEKGLPGMAPGSRGSVLRRIRIHPWSVGELLRTEGGRGLLQPPVELPKAEWDALWTYGGFPEPFRARNPSSASRWRTQCREELLRAVRRRVKVQAPTALNALLDLLEQGSGASLESAVLAKELGVSIPTIHRWLGILEDFQFGFTLRTWEPGVLRSCRKKRWWYVRDWSRVADRAARFETLVACHLLKSVEGWEDQGLGSFELRSVRSRRGYGADFLVTINGQPEFLANAVIECNEVPGSLANLRRAIGAPKAIQVALERAFQGVDAFAKNAPACVLVSAREFLSQLL